MLILYCGNYRIYSIAESGVFIVQERSLNMHEGIKRAAGIFLAAQKFL